MANGLINLQTDLKSLRYGNDKPYITKNIGDAPGSQLGLEVQARIDDTSRIAQMLIDKPGIKYLLNEALLQQVNIDDKIKNRGNKTVAGAVLGQLGNTLIGTAKILGSTLAQVPVNGTGLHFLKGFRTDTYLQPTNGNQASGFAQFFGAGGVEGAPLALQGKPIEGVVESNLLVQKNQFDNKEKHPDIDVSKEIQVSPEESAQRYSKDSTFTGNSTYFNINAAKRGTPIRVQPSTTAESKTRETTKSPGYQGSRSNAISTISGSEYTSEQEQYTNASGKSQLYDKNNPTKSTYTVQQKNRLTLNKNVTKEYRVGLGDQGAQGTPEKQSARRSNQYWFMSDKADPTKSAEVDKINALAPQDGQVSGEREGRDIVKFRFHILTPDQTGDGKVLYFRAFLDSFNDAYTGTWNPTKYLGRAEDFQVYGGFQRKISLSFKIAAATRVEMKPLYQKMIWLASATAPTYTADKQFMRGTIVKMTVGDYVYELPGVLNSLTYTWQQDYPWEIAMLEPEGTKEGDKQMQELPMIMDCQLDFTPIHTFTPETGLNKFFTAGNSGKNSYI
jgi:hypothetical protein